MTDATTIRIHERPIIMSGPMIRALLEGRKTQTRRPLGELYVDLRSEVRGDWPLGHRFVAPRGRYRARLNAGGAVTIATNASVADGRARVTPDYNLGVKPGEFHFVCPYAAGDTLLADYPHASGKGWATKWTIQQRATTRSVLWVRETWCRGSDEDASEHAYVPADMTGRPRGPIYPGGEFPAYAYYKATDPDIVNSNDEDRSPWKSPIHMPRWACRLELDVVHARIERLQDISEEDAIAEGARHYGDLYNPRPEHRDPPRWSMDIPTIPVSTDHCLGSARFAYGHAWNHLHGRGAWETNPWVWVIEFRPRAITRPWVEDRDPAEFQYDTIRAAAGIRHHKATRLA